MASGQRIPPPSQRVLFQGVAFASCRSVAKIASRTLARLHNGKGSAQTSGRLAALAVLRV